MISIIICHRDNNYLKKLRKNIEVTIGTDYELIVIDNANNEYNIFQAYNLGIRKSRYNILCFMHEDIVFHTNGWGEKVIEHYKNKRLAILGVVGSHYIPRMPCSHWSSGISSGGTVRNIDGTLWYNFKKHTEDDKFSSEAVLLDGLWLCTSREFIQKAMFDEITYSGFHCYDSDICMQAINLGFEVRIAFDIKIEHLSYGKPDYLWLDSIFKWYNKWHRVLPVSKVKMSQEDISRANYKAANQIIGSVRDIKYSLIRIIKLRFYYLRCNPPISKINIILLFQPMYRRIRIVREKNKDVSC